MKGQDRGRKLIKGFIIGIFLMLVFITTINAAPKGFSKEQDLLKLSNKYYEIALDPSNGGIKYILDKKIKQNVSMGDRDGSLWGAWLENGTWLSGSAYNSHFDYLWEPQNKKLTLNYHGTTAPNLIDVTVNIFISDQQWFKMQATVNNHSNSNIQTFQFPYQLNILESGIRDALLPMIPGVKLRSEFFAAQKSYEDQYPGVMFADYVAIQSSQGNLAIYGQKGDQLQPVNIGFSHKSDGYTAMVHDYKTWIENGKLWTSPTVTLNIGADYQGSIAAYRKDNGIDKFKSLDEKLGAKKQKFFESPLYKLDLKNQRKTFTQLKTVIDQLKVPGLIHPVAFQINGHDHHYPDFLPPDPAYGTNESFADMVKYAQSKGNLVAPYTNFSWWNLDSSTLENLSVDIDLQDITVDELDGNPVSESYGSLGYVVNFHNDFVKNRIADEQGKLIKTIGFDGLFEDQLGARNAPYDFNPVGLNGHDPATSYYEGVLDHARSLAGNNLMTECGIDRLAENEIAFMGTNYLWDQLGYRQTTADYSDYYPMMGMLCRDKTLLYQHDLAIETWTNNPTMFRWNLAMGYNFSIALNDMTNPWLPLVGVFQKYVLSRYAGELITGFDSPANQITRTSFVNYKVYANWNPRDSFSQAGHVIAPGGVMVIANDGSVTAGKFTNINGYLLSEGDHYLIELRSKDNIKVFQPIGTSTNIHIKKYPSWRGVKVAAYGYDDKLISEVDAMTLKDDVSFDYNMERSNQKVAYYQLTQSAEPNLKFYPIPQIPDLTVTAISWSPAEPTIGDPVTFQATVKNTGTGPVPAGTIINVSFQIDGKDAFWSEYFKAGLATGASVTLNVTRGETDKTWKATTGTHVISAHVDPDKKIASINSNNKTFSKNMSSVDEAIIVGGIKRPKSAANLALNKPIDSSGATATPYSEKLANDGFINSYWESVNNVFPSYLTVDLDSTLNVNKIVLKLPPSWETRIQTITVLGGVDGESFDTIVNSAEYTFDPAATNTVTINFNLTAVRYLKLLITANSGWPAGQLAEFEVYSSKN